MTLADLPGEIGVGTRQDGGRPYVEFSAGDVVTGVEYKNEIWSASAIGTAVADGLMLRPRELGTVRHVIASRKLRGSYGQGSTTLEARDVADLTADLKAGVAALEARARILGGGIHPRLARAVVRDLSGNIMAAGMPLLLMPAAGLTPTVIITVSAADGSTGDIELTATAWDIEAVWAAGGKPAGVDSVEVVASEGLSPVDAAAPLTCRRAGLATSGPKFEIALPGFPLGRGAYNPLVPKIVKALDRFMNTGGTRCGICRRGCLLPSYRRCRLDSSPGRTAANGTLQVAAAPRRMAVACVSPLNHAVSAGPGSWSGAVATVYGHSGEDVSRPRVERRTFSMSSMMPLTLSPLVVVPDGDAVSHTIAVGSGGVTLPMTSAGAYSYYLASDLEPIALTATVPSLPAANPASSPSTAAAVMVSEVTAPSMPLLATALEAGTEILAVTPAARSRSAWDFGRAHFYLMTTAGIYAMAVNAARTRIDTSLIDPRAVNAPGAVAVTPRGVVAASGRSLLLVTGTAATDVATLESPAAGLGWDNSRSELRIIMADGSAWIADAAFGSMSRCDFSPEAFHADGGALYATGSNTVYRVDAPELMRRLTEIEWSREIDVPAGKSAVAVRWDVTGSAILGTFDIVSDLGSRLLRLNVDGRLVAPLPARFLAPRRCRLVARISAQVSADTVVRGVTLKFQ